MSDEKQKRREINLIEKSKANLVEMGVFEDKAIDFDDQKVKLIDLIDFIHKSTTFNESTKLSMDQKDESSYSGVQSIEYDIKQLPIFCQSSLEVDTTMNFGNKAGFYVADGGDEDKDEGL